jgi:hypothetical protein
MKVATLYLDTSIIGGYFDEEFAEPTRLLWRQMEEGRWRFVTSLLVGQEMTGAPDDVRTLMTSTFTQSDLLPLTLEVEQLASAYLDQSIVSARFADDARHVAAATVHRVDYVVSWNFQHMVNVRREAAFNAVNLLQGYGSVRILSPLELIYEYLDEEEKEL